MSKPMEAEIDATLLKLSKARPGDVLVICSVSASASHDFADQLCEAARRLPAGSIPMIPIVFTGPQVDFALVDGASLP